MFDEPVGECDPDADIGDEFAWQIFKLALFLAVMLGIGTAAGMGIAWVIDNWPLFSPWFH